jgi:hypothetical protein
MPSLVYILFGASFTVATAWALGALLLRRLAAALSRLEACLVAIIVGSACLSIVVFGLCAVNLARKGVYLGFGLLTIALAVRYTRRAFRSEPFPALPPAWKWLFVAVFITLTVLYFRNVVTPHMVPGTTSDRLSLLDREHGFKGLTNLPVRLPEGLGLLALPAFAFGRHPAAALVNVAFFGTLLMLMLCYGRRIGQPRAGIGAAVLLFASTMIGQSTIAGVLVAIFYLFLVKFEDRASETLYIIYGTRHSRIVGAVGGIAIAAIFLWFARPGLAYYFDTDDITNLGRACSQPLHKLLLDTLPIFGSPTRALGQMTYRGLFALADLHPLPYHLFCLTLLATNIYLLYRLAFALTESKAAAMLAALIGCFHSRMESLYSSIGNIFDIGCCTFFLLTMLYYLHSRQNGGNPGVKNLIILAALYLCALNFKEMAATLPAVLVCYELIYRGKSGFKFPGYDVGSASRSSP